MKKNSSIQNASKLLIVDDVKPSGDMLSEVLINEGHVVETVTNVADAVNILQNHTIDLIITDLSMPGVDGYEFCRIVKKNVKTSNIPIIVLTAYDSIDVLVKCFSLGVTDYVTKPFDYKNLICRVNVHATAYRRQRWLEMYNTNLYRMMNTQIRNVILEEKNIIFAVVELIAQRCNIKKERLILIGQNCRKLAMALQFVTNYECEVSNSFIDTIELVAPFYDIGKICVSDEIIKKRGPHIESEKIIYQKHTEYGANVFHQILQNNIHSEIFEMARDITYYHHEYWNGGGYPKGLIGNDIPLSARIVSVIDTFDQLTHNKNYQQAYTKEESVKIIYNDSGVMFDPEIVKVFMKIWNQLEI